MTNFAEASSGGTASAVQYLSFQVGAEEYAVELLRVREIVRYETVTRVPGAAACVRGVLNLRGNVVPAIDLALGLGLPEAPLTPQTCILIVEAAVDGEAALMGVIVEAVSRVFDLKEEEVEPPPSFGTRVPVDFLKGMARAENGFVLLCDLDRLLGEVVLRHGPATLAPGAGGPPHE
jgi:purine-binding chemotaxis protein CheW